MLTQNKIPIQTHKESVQRALVCLPRYSCTDWYLTADSRCFYWLTIPATWVGFKWLFKFNMVPSKALFLPHCHTHTHNTHTSMHAHSHARRQTETLLFHSKLEVKYRLCVVSFSFVYVSVWLRLPLTVSVWNCFFFFKTGPNINQ